MAVTKTRCEHCQGEGRVIVQGVAQRGDTDPREVDCGECPWCQGAGTTAGLSDMHMIVLKEVRDRRVTTLTAMPELMRQKVMDLGMEEPPLVDTMDDAIFVTTAGERELLRRGQL